MPLRLFYRVLLVWKLYIVFVTFEAPIEWVKRLRNTFIGGFRSFNDWRLEGNDHQFYYVDCTFPCVSSKTRQFFKMLINCSSFYTHLLISTKVFGEWFFISNSLFGWIERNRIEKIFCSEHDAKFELKWRRKIDVKKGIRRIFRERATSDLNFSLCFALRKIH